MLLFFFSSAWRFLCIISLESGGGLDALCGIFWCLGLLVHVRHEAFYAFCMCRMGLAHSLVTIEMVGYQIDVALS